MQKSLNVALVGYGFVGRIFHAPLIASIDGLVLHTVVSSQAQAVHEDFPDVSVQADLTSALQDSAIDVVVIATPNALHAPQAHAAFDAGKHVVVDKPFTVTVSEATALVAHAERVGRALTVFHNRRWDSDFLTLRAVIARGSLGEVTQFESHFDRFRPEVRDRWRERAEPGAGLWYDLGPHLLDQALQLFGAPVAVMADIAKQRDGAQSDDYFHVTLRYPRLRVVLHASTLVTASDLRFAVHGTKGSFMKNGLDTQEDALKAGRTPGDAGWGFDPRAGVLSVMHGETIESRVTEGVPGDYRQFYCGVRDAIRDGAALPVTAAEAVQVMQLIACGIQSAAERREITVAA
jgi:predicted dehydrogenase